MEDTANTILDSATMLLLTAAYKKLRLLTKKPKKPKRKKRRYSVKPLNRDRKENGYYVSSFLKMQNMDETSFFEYTRMKRETFDKLLQMISHHLTKNSIKEPISPSERLAVTLHYLAHGSSMAETAFVYKLGRTTVSKIIFETCSAIWIELNALYLPEPDTEMWKQKAAMFEECWQAPHCCGAIDGKHIHIQAPLRSGSLYFNYKKMFSINLMAISDATYKFIYVNIGAEGTHHDATVFRESHFGQKIMSGNIGLPNPDELVHSTIKFPYYFAADAAFPLTTNILRPYPEQNLTVEEDIFNYRHGRARRTVENAFGILTSRWRILHRPIIGRVRLAKVIVAALICLHNFIMSDCTSSAMYRLPDANIGKSDLKRINTSNGAIRDMGQMSSNNATKLAFKNRDILKEYYVKNLALPWQWEKVNKFRKQRALRKY